MSRIINEFSWKIGGEAGFGIMATGAIFAKTCARIGLQVIDYSEYPSLIRGGHNTFQVRVSEQPLWSHHGAVEFLVALNKQTVERHVAEVVSGGVIMYDLDDPSFRGWDSKNLAGAKIQYIGIPMGSLARQAGADTLMRNTVALGAAFGLLSLDFPLVSEVVTEIFFHKGQAVVDLNLKVLQAGFSAISQEQSKNFPYDLVPKTGSDHMLISGNEAISLGALSAGCSFFAAYPMTPASSILHTLAEVGPGQGMFVRHAEDEIAVVNETIGAAYAGARAMCATAGGGFALMTEAVGLASMTEIGLVIIEAQRGGPSTGLPTWTEQGDLRQVLHASQGEAHKVVLAPSSIEECFYLTQKAFDIAEEYQVPVILMTDKHLAEGHASIPMIPAHSPALRRGKVDRQPVVSQAPMYPRYDWHVADGISFRTLPGTPNGMFLVNSDEHDQFGITTEEADIRLAQMDKRLRKMQTWQEKCPWPELEGPKTASVTLVSWGSSLGAVREAVAMLLQQYGIKANVLPIVYIHPWPLMDWDKFRQQAKQLIMIEANQSGQMAGWIREQTGISFDHHIRRYDGRPFLPHELAQNIHQLVT